MKFLPKIYKKSLHDINYDKLKDKGIKCLVFDLDNTLILKKQKKLKLKEKKLLETLKKDFLVIILSNNKSKSLVGSIAKEVDVPFYYLSFKPLLRNLKKIQNKYGLKKEEICMIGDQLMTDVWGANRFGCISCLVTPLNMDEIKITGINRFFENKIFKKYEQKNIMKRGKYYE